VTTPAFDSAADHMLTVLAEIAAERSAQDTKWGEQNHPDGTGPTDDARRAALEAKIRTDRAADEGRCTWALILLEEVFEALAEHDPARLRAELVQVAAVAVSWVQAIDRRADS
jgi:hypothetical protein